MATIVDLEAPVRKVSFVPARWVLDISYSIELPEPEAGAWFTETVEIRNQQSQTLARLRSEPFQVPAATGKQKVRRELPPVEISSIPSASAIWRVEYPDNPTRRLKVHVEVSPVAPASVEATVDAG